MTSLIVNAPLREDSQPSESESVQESNNKFAKIVLSPVFTHLKLWMGDKVLLISPTIIPISNPQGQVNDQDEPYITSILIPAANSRSVQNLSTKTDIDTSTEMGDSTLVHTSMPGSARKINPGTPSGSQNPPLITNSHQGGSIPSDHGMGICTPIGTPTNNTACENNTEMPSIGHPAGEITDEGEGMGSSIV